MLDAFGQGLLAASSLVIGALVALLRPPSHRVLGLVMALGSGVLISSVAYELVGEAFTTGAGNGGIALGLVAGAVTFFVGDVLVARLGGAGRKDLAGAQAGGSGLAIVLGTVLDGIPESVVLGVGLVSSADPDPAMLVAVFLSNLPEAMASTAGLHEAGWSGASLLVIWVSIAVVSGLAAAFGYGLAGDASAWAVAFVLAYAAGAVLTMLADTMMPDAFEHGGPLVGVVTTVGFGAGFALTTL